MLPTGAANIVVLAIWIAPCPADGIVNMPGAAEDIVRVMEELIPPAVVTVKVEVAEDSSSQGIWKLIWPEETKNSGHRMLFIRTLVPPRAVGKGRLVAAKVLAARFVP